MQTDLEEPRSDPAVRLRARPDDGGEDSASAESSPATVKTARRVGIVATLVGFLAVMVLNAELPAHPTGTTETRRNTLRIFIPEGWAFFTLSPRKTLPRPMRPHDDRWVSAAAGPNAAVRSGLGVNRIRRAQGTEIALILRTVPPDAWTSCDREPTECLSAVTVSHPATDEAARPSLCGSVGLIDQQPLPWAWRHAEHQTVMPSKVIRMEVQCPTSTRH